MSSRTKMTAKNAFWSYFSMILTLIIGFISRTFFIRYLGEVYLGVNGLFTNVLGILSFAELGIGTAINFSLYKPVARNDIDKIKSYMHYYKIAYRYIALVITILGLVLLPFLKFIVKDPGDVGDIRIYYLLFLVDTVSSYFVTYKFSLVNAEQKNYIFTNVNLVLGITKSIVQIVIIVLFRNYLYYLSFGICFSLIQKVFVAKYLNKLYPYLLDKDVESLKPEEKRTLITKIKSLVIHNIGDICVRQTDNVIISAFVNVATVGLLSNYYLIINNVSTYIGVLFSSATGSLGNLIATEDKTRQYEVFKVYRFIGFWFYGFTGIVLMVLLKPFIILWIGEKMIVEDLVIGLILINYYMVGQRICFNNFKSAAGQFEKDKFIALIQAVVNLTASIVLVKIIGLPGVYIGTLIQGSIASFSKPILLFKKIFDKSCKYYFIDSLKYALCAAIAFIICWLIRVHLLESVTIIRFILMGVIVSVIPNLFFFIVFRKREEFVYINKLFDNVLLKIKSFLINTNKRVLKK